MGIRKGHTNGTEAHSQHSFKNSVKILHKEKPLSYFKQNGNIGQNVEQRQKRSGTIGGSNEEKCGTHSKRLQPTHSIYIVTTKVQ